jgi:hypothetical protein
MPDGRYQLEARPHPDGALRWIVTSRSRPDIEHLVELAAFGGIGRCSCEHFEFRIAPDLRNGRRVGAHRCSHILAARNAFTDAMIQTLVRMKQERTATATECPYCGNTTNTPGACPECQQEINANENPEDPETEDG